MVPSSGSRAGIRGFSVLVSGTHSQGWQPGGSVQLLIFIQTQILKKQQYSNSNKHLFALTPLIIQCDGCDSFLQHSKSKSGSMIVSTGFNAVSMSLRRECYFVVIAVNAENADSHKYVETNGKSAVTAKSDNVGNSALTPILEVQSFFPENSSCKRESEESLTSFCDILKRGLPCPVLVFQMGFVSNQT